MLISSASEIMINFFWSFIEEEQEENSILYM